MKALVTGATGFVGSHVARVLVAAGHDVTVLRREASPLANLAGLACRQVVGDLGDEKSLEQAAQGQEVVFHVAALYAQWAADPALFAQTNVCGTRRMIRAAAEAGARRIVYTSTLASVGGAQDGTPVDETSPFNLESTGDPYVLTKRRAEEAALELAAQGAPVIVVNPTAPLGPGDIKPTPTGDVLVKFVNGQIPGYLEGGINIVDVRDVARGHLLAAERGRVGERYILGGENVTMLELMQRLGHVTGLRPPAIKLPFSLALGLGATLDLVSTVTRRAPLVTRSGVRALRHPLWGSSAKAERELGYGAGPADTAIREAVAWFHERGLLSARRMRRVLAHWGESAAIEAPQ